MGLSIELANITWMLAAAALVMLMQGGFCFLESGLARAKNSINVAMKNLADFCISALLFWICGFGLMFGLDWNGWFGTSLFFMEEIDNAWLLAFFLFQLVFCGTATTIVSGAVAERMRFSGYLAVSAVISAIIYPVFGHWAWGGVIENTGTGWLSERGFIDFAGSTVVHSVGGWVALVTAILVGPRLGRFHQNGRKLQGHNYPMATLGTILLWFGWFGFNGGSTLAINSSIPLILVNTNLAAAAGGVAGLVLSRLVHGRPEVGDIINGVIAGLVGITASCHIMTPSAAFLIGIISSAVCMAGTCLLERLKIDDVIGAVPAHAMCGVWGTIAVALLADPAKFGTGLSRLEQLNVQLLGVGTCLVWSCGVAFVALKLIQLAIPLRVSEEAESQGLNISEHGASTEIVELLNDMRVQSEHGDFNSHVAVEPHTEVGQIAAEYNKVLHRVVEEIEQREAVMLRLKVAEEKFRSIFENATEGIYRTSVRGRILEANPSLAEMLGYDSPQELMNEITDLRNQVYVCPEDRDVLIEQLRVEKSVTRFTTRMFRKDGSVIHISLNARYHFEKSNEADYIEGSLTDITQQVESAVLRQEKESAEAASKAKSTFLATMSHEIRTPLNGVIGMLDLLSETEMSGKQSRYAGIAKSSAESLLSLINDILDFSKIEAGKLELSLGEFNLPSLVEDVCDMFGHRAEQKGLELSCHILPEVAARVVGDPERLRQILVNLIGNALKFTEVGEVQVHVTAHARETGHQVIRFEVQDTGVGIPTDIQGRLFQAFEQADASTTRKYGGTGLGLAICRQLTELMGGEINVCSTLGHGSTFWCEIPFTVVKRQVVGRQMDYRFQGLRILAVDDNPTNRAILETQMSNWGAEVTTAHSGPEALALLKQAAEEGRPFELSVIDYRMPEMDGIDLARSVKRDEVISGTRLLMLTSSDSMQSQAELREIGIDACSTKPIRPSRLFNEIITILYRPEEDFGPELNPVISQVQSPVEAASAADYRILIAEDNEINQIVTQEIIEQAGFQCRIVENGKEALELLKRRHFDLVLMDCQMPVMDGFTATREIRRQQKLGRLHETTPNPLPIIALTANAVKGDRERCLEAGMNSYVAKPIDPQLLIKTIKVMLQQSTPATPENHVLLEHQPGTSSPLPSDDQAETDTDGVNWRAVTDRCGGSTIVAAKVVRKFQARVRDDISTLEQAFSGNDWETTTRMAHSLKGAAASIAADSVAEVAALIEAHARKQSAQEIPESLAELKQRTDRCIEFIEAHIEEALAV